MPYAIMNIRGDNMILLLGGATHCGKTKLAQKLLETYHIPYYSIDHIKMGLIRAHISDICVENDKALTSYLWPIMKEIILTAIENNQHFIIEGCYIPFDWQKDFTEEERKKIHYCCLIFSKSYIEQHQKEIFQYANCIEQRKEEALDIDALIKDNLNHLQSCKQYHLPYILIDNTYAIDIENNFAFLKQK